MTLFGVSIALAVSLSLLVVVVVALFWGYYIYRRFRADKKITESKERAKRIVEEASQEAEAKRREAIIEIKDEALKLRQEFEKETKERRGQLTEIEKRLIAREEHIDKREEETSQKEKTAVEKLQELQRLKEKIEEKYQTLVVALEKVAGLTRDQAKQLLLQFIEKDVMKDAAALIKKTEEEAKVTAARKATEIITTAIQRCDLDHVIDSTISVVNLPNDEMKGRVIGREGRNIRTFEALTGVDLVIDDTPGAVVVSGFDPVRREIAKQTLESLVVDGRIHPARVEEMFNKASRQVEANIAERGQAAALELGVDNLNPKIIQVVGRLHYRTSYGQNVLQHSMEVAYLAGIMAQELGVNYKLARRAGLLHDIGKAIDQEVEGNHYQIGADLARRYGEHPEVVHAIAAHHQDIEPSTVEAVLVMVADAISASRPGARRESLEAYIKRLEKLETIANGFDGVAKTYAIQAGREVRVMVRPEQIDDQTAAKLAHDIAKKIENEMEYPGQVKVTVIRETRATDIAK